MYARNGFLDVVIDEVINEMLVEVMKDEYLRGIGTGVGAAVLCLYNAGHLKDEALAYAGVLGDPAIDPLIVANLGIYRGGAEQFQADMEAAFKDHETEVSRAVSDLEAAADHLRAQHATPVEENSDDGTGEAPAATED
jgi:hypothetical protein